MNENNQFDTPEQKEDDFNLYRLIFKYLIYWPWFVASVIICLGAAFVYMRFQTPIYNVTAAVLVKEDDPRTHAMKAANGAIEALQGMGGLSMTNNFDNEVEILKSRTLIRKVVTHLGLYISTSEDRTFGYTSVQKCSRTSLSYTRRSRETGRRSQTENDLYSGGKIECTGEIHAQ